MLRQQSTLFHRLHQYSVFFGACCIAVRFEPIIPSHSIFSPVILMPQWSELRSASFSIFIALSAFFLWQWENWAWSMLLVWSFLPNRSGSVSEIAFWSPPFRWFAAGSLPTPPRRRRWPATRPLTMPRGTRFQKEMPWRTGVEVAEPLSRWIFLRLVSIGLYNII